jgi:hypothetical protein
MYSTLKPQKHPQKQPQKQPLALIPSKLAHKKEKRKKRSRFTVL